MFLLTVFYAVLDIETAEMSDAADAARARRARMRILRVSKGGALVLEE
jgi:hypothetical protein